MPKYQVTFSYTYEIEVDGDERDAEDEAGEMFAHILAEGDIDVRDFGAVVNEGWLHMDEAISDSEYGCPICQANLPNMHEWELHMDYCETVNGDSCEMCGADEHHEESDSLCTQCYEENNSGN